MTDVDWYLVLLLLPIFSATIVVQKISGECSEKQNYFSSWSSEYYLLPLLVSAPGLDPPVSHSVVEAAGAGGGGGTPGWDWSGAGHMGCPVTRSGVVIRVIIGAGSPAVLTGSKLFDRSRGLTIWKIFDWTLEIISCRSVQWFWPVDLRNHVCVTHDVSDICWNHQDQGFNL